MKNLKNKKLKKCSINPMTGYSRDGYCRPIYGDYGSHLVCGLMDEKFLNYSTSMGNNLRSVVKKGDKWCLCQNRYYEAYMDKKAPKVILNATHKNIKSYVKKAILNSTKSKKNKKINKKINKKRKSIKIGKNGNIKKKVKL
tara:strand:- start:1363 stop:1785 length:423 start_codon:yes stop_codon:yes gene_type:complete